jgi:hypothetical protein
MKRILILVAVIMVAGVVSATNLFESLSGVGNLNGKNFSAPLHIAKIPDFESTYPGGGIGVATLYVNTFEKTIISSYKPIDLREMIADKFAAYKQKENANVKVSFDSVVQDLDIPDKSSKFQVVKVNPNRPDYDFSGIKSSISAQYIFDFKVMHWGHDGKDAKARMEYCASIIEVATGKFLWLKQGKEEYKPSITSSNAGFTEEKANEYMTHVVDQTVKECMTSLK